MGLVQLFSHFLTLLTDKPPISTKKQENKKSQRKREKKSQRSKKLGPIFSTIYPPETSKNKSPTSILCFGNIIITPIQPQIIKRERIPPEIRKATWMKYHGIKTQGICYCCGKKIERDNAGWHCSHVISDVKGGQPKIDNLRTCCQHCNLSMGNQNLYVYILNKKLKGPGSQAAQKYLQYHPDQIGDKRTNNWGKV